MGVARRRGTEDLPVLLNGPRCVCKLCKNASTDLSPLSAAPNDRYAGKLPWAKYLKVREGDEVVGKQPSSRTCLICLNVYNALGAAFMHCHRSRPQGEETSPSGASEVSISHGHARDTGFLQLSKVP